VPYKVKIANTESNNSFLANLPKEIIPELEKHLKYLGDHPYLGRSVEAPIPAYIYSFGITHQGQKNTFVVSYKMDENSETIFITSLGRHTIKNL
jgi:hypothetical protein